MRTSAAFYSLIAELNADEAELRRLHQQNLRAWRRIESGANDVLDWGALGFTLHTLYGVLENYFLRISKFFENNLPPERWHKVLVEKMALELPPIRPALLTEASMKSAALEWLKFRHRIRNLYGEDLDPAKTAEVQRFANDFLDNFPEAHRAFVAKLTAVAEKLP